MSDVVRDRALELPLCHGEVVEGGKYGDNHQDALYEACGGSPLGHTSPIPQAAHPLQLRAATARSVVGGGILCTRLRLS